MKFKPINIFLYSASVVILISGVFLFYLLFSPVQVLTHWQLKVDGSKPYMPASTVNISSTYTKVRNVSGVSKKYLQCHKPNSTEWDSYIPLTESDANKPSITVGHSVTAVAIPLDVPSLPNTCRIYIHVSYQINPLRTYEQYNYSNSFHVNKPISPIVQQQSLAPQPDTNSQQAIVTPSITPETGDSNTTIPQPQTTDTFQNNEAPSTPENAPPTKQKGIIGRILQIAGL